MEQNLRRLKNTPHPKKPKTVADVSNIFNNPSVISQYGLNLRRTERFYITTVEEEAYAFTLSRFLLHSR